MEPTSQLELGTDDRQREAAIRALFPLPLTPFELFMLLDDRPEQPMTFCVEMAFHGRILREAFQLAVDQAALRHPLLRARVAWPERHPVWMLLDSHSTPVNWVHTTRAAADAIRPIDLRQSAGLRIFVEDGETRSTVWLQLHHACCDGAGARRFMVDVLTGYARACGRHSLVPDWDELDYSSLCRRHEFPAPSKNVTKQSTSVWKKLQDAFHFHVLTPRPLAATDQSRSDAARATSIHRHVFTAHEYTRLRQLTRDSGVSLNDVALALLFNTLADWNRRFGSTSATQRLRILMPTDLRTAADDRMPAANRMSFSFLARTSGDCQHWDSLLAGIRAESQYIRDVRIGLDFLSGIGLVHRVPGLLPLLLQLPRCLATALLTNLGDPTKRFRRRFPAHQDSVVAGNLVLDQLFGLPPLRSYMHAGFGLCICSRQLCISLVGNGQVLGEQANDLLQSYVQQWRNWGDLS